MIPERKIDHRSIILSGISGVLIGAERKQKDVFRGTDFMIVLEIAIEIAENVRTNVIDVGFQCFDFYCNFKNNHKIPLTKIPPPLS